MLSLSSRCLDLKTILQIHLLQESVTNNTLSVLASACTKVFVREPGSIHLRMSAKTQNPNDTIRIIGILVLFWESVTQHAFLYSLRS